MILVFQYIADIPWLQKVFSENWEKINEQIEKTNMNFDVWPNPCNLCTWIDQNMAILINKLQLSELTKVWATIVN